MTKTTLRIELARNKMTVKDLIEKTGLARETINAVIDGDYSNSNIRSLKAIEQALPNVEMVIRLETKQ
jgi:DNA-binding Xre family transcriptional regulator